MPDYMSFVTGALTKEKAEEFIEYAKQDIIDSHILEREGMRGIEYVVAGIASITDCGMPLELKTICGTVEVSCVCIDIHYPDFKYSSRWYVDEGGKHYKIIEQE